MHESSEKKNVQVHPLPSLPDWLGFFIVRTQANLNNDGFKHRSGA